MPGPRPPGERHVPMTPFLARHERFERVGSTNDVVREWLAAGTPEICLAVADEQTAGRGREGRRWQAPPGGALLASLGFRPGWLEPADTWRLAATASLAMAEAAEHVAGLPAGTIRLKWPNDLVLETGGADPQDRRRAGRDRRPRHARPARRHRHRRQHGLDRRRLPAGPGRVDDVVARGGRRPSRRLGPASRRLPRTARAARRGAPGGRLRGRDLGCPPGDDRADRPTRDVRR